MYYRVRYGYAHVANNRYDQWIMYAIGGSADPTILSEGNYFVASDQVKEVRHNNLILLLIKGKMLFMIVE